MVARLCPPGLAVHRPGVLRQFIGLRFVTLVPVENRSASPMNHNAAADLPDQRPTSPALPSTRRNRFTTLLVAGIGLLNLVVVLLLWLTLNQGYQNTLHEVQTTARNLTRLLAHDVNQTLEGIDKAVLAIDDEASEHIRKGEEIDVGDINVLAGRHKERMSHLKQLGLFDAQGSLMLPGDALPEPHQSIANQDFFAELRRGPTSDSHLDKPTISLSTDGSSLVMARRVSDPQGGFVGVAAGFFDLETMTAPMRDIDSGPHGMVVLRDAQRRVIARYPSTPRSRETLGHQVVTPELVAELQVNPDFGVFHVRSPIDQIERTMAYGAVSSYPFSVVLGLADDDYFKEWRQNAIRSSLMVLLFGLVTLGFGWLIHRAWTRREADLDLIGEQERRFRNLIESSPYPLIVTDGNGLITLVNQELETLLGYRSEELVGEMATRLVPERYRGTGDGAWLKFYKSISVHETNRRNVWWVLTKQGQEIPTNVSFRPLHTAQGEAVAIAVIDIRESLRASERIEFLAYHDALTELPNRRLLLERIKHARASCERTGFHAALLLLDLDDFKTLNDSLGHDKGDLLLQEVGRRLVRGVREGDTVARLGGDEFVVLFEGLSEDAQNAANQVEALAEKMISALTKTYQLDGCTVHSTPSIGATLIAGLQFSVEELMRQADMAMYQSKKVGRSTLRFFDPQMQALVTQRAAMESALREAIDRQRLVLHYQMQVREEHEITGVEALVRWHHPERGLVGPLDFIALAEETGLILPLGKWVLETACAQLTRWAGNPDTAHLTLSINVSAHQFRQSNFVEQVLQALERAGTNPYRLKLELTESLLVTDVEGTIGKMTELRNEGVGFSLDDFGTGYSSLSYLKRLPLTQLKIDQEFVKNILHDPNDAAIARMVIALADTMGLDVIAEGVENEDQRCLLAEMGCHHCQGYLFSEPLPVEELEILTACA